MKTSNKIFISGLLAILLTLVSYILYQKYSTPMVDVRGTAEPEWQTLSTQKFKKLSVNRFNTEIIYAEKYKVELWIDPTILEHFTPEVSEGELKIKVANGKYEFKKAPKLKISCPTLSALSIYSQTCNANINAEKLNVKASSSGKLNLNGEFNLLELSAQNASNITLNGSAKIAKMDISSASVLNAKNMPINNVNALCRNASQMTINVIDDLQANASSASVIQYYGNPKNSEVNATSAAVITALK